MRLTIVRHGPTRGNVLKQWVGSTDMPLSPEGLSITQAARKDDSISLVHVTPLQRTQQTAAILYPKARQIIVPDLQEMNFGVFEGKGYEELEHDPVFIKWNENGGLDPMPGGEGRRGFGERVVTALRGLVSQSIQQGDKELHILAHGGTIMALLAMLGEPQKPYQDWWVDNLQGYSMRIDRDTWADEPRLYDIEAISFAD